MFVLIMPGKPCFLEKLTPLAKIYTDKSHLWLGESHRLANITVLNLTALPAIFGHIKYPTPNPN